MSKLLRAYFARLKKDKSMRFFTAGMFIMAAAIVLNGVRLNLLNPNEEHFSSLERFTFRIVPYISIFCSVIISLFFGKEHSDGTLRNKLAAGHTRTHFYMASLIVAGVISELVALAWFAGGLLGIPHFGLWTLAPEQLLTYLLLILLSTAALASIFTLMSVLITNRTSSAVAAILASFGMILLGSVLYNSLCEPETISDGVTITSDGNIHFGNEIPNPAYIGGTARTIYTVILNVLPAGQGILIANYNDDIAILRPEMAVCGSIFIIAAADACGMFFFRKKDLK